MEKIQYPNLTSSTVAELTAFYNEHSGQDPIKKFKDKATAQQAVQLVMAKLEGDEDPELAEELAEVVEENATSMLAQLVSANGDSGGKKSSSKNEGVWLNVKRILDETNGARTNKEILADIEELYGNSNTSYACIAWYRNKWKKSAPSLSLQERIEEARATLAALEAEAAALEAEEEGPGE